MLRNIICFLDFFLICCYSQVALGEIKKDKSIEPVVLYLKVADQKLVLGTLIKDSIPHLALDIVLDKESELSHNSKTASIYFSGYKVLQYDSDSCFFIISLFTFI